MTDEQIEKCIFHAGLDEDLWFGRFTPKGYEDAMPKLRKFAEAVRAADQTIFGRMEDGRSAEHEAEERIAEILGIRLLGIGFDTYDASFEIYPWEDVVDVAPTQEQHDQILALGCTRYWINFPDDSQRYGTGNRVSANGQRRWQAHNSCQEKQRSFKVTREERDSVKEIIAGLAFICEISDTGQLVDHAFDNLEKRRNAGAEATSK